MMKSHASRQKSRVSRARRKSGFSMLEVLISMVVLTIGLFSMLSMFTMALAATSVTEEDLMGRELAEEALESIYTARNTGQISFSQIENISAPDGLGIFMDNPQVVKDEGLDGIIGTLDDTNVNSGVCPGVAKCVPIPGPDGLMNSNAGANKWRSLAEFTRTIVIGQTLLPLAQGGGLDTSLRSITVTVNYSAQGKVKSYVAAGFISQYR